MRRRTCLALTFAPLAGCAVQAEAWLAEAPAGLPTRLELSRTPFFPQTDLHCGPAALATALGAVGLVASPAQLGGEVFLPARGGSLQAEMLAGARRHGAVAVRIPGTVEAVLREVAAGHVVVVLLNLGLAIAPRWHYAVVVGYDLDQRELLMRSGTVERDRIALRTFEHTWARADHWAFVALPPGRWPLTARASAAVEAAVGFERSASPAQALKVYESGLERWPESLPLAIGLGTSAYAVRDTARAKDVFRRAGEQHGSGAAWLNLARLLQAEGKRDDAIAAAQRALRDPQWAAQARLLLDQPTMRP
ncbi:PA2778 family cysteine peptidase [Piscinibacter gummiphilus]|uniref:PA2778 family cysteine peptidase n=1 Tax=Piscinibacter gummiphilus TaxID=946333 RepID=A0ABZ0CNV1_9BURK|nr:PA2778 family cysteine peptidase [Piscinibacter gummiphilus]WOB06649.1 PA2778 family cysteine peptidase [Piscinibacter gummiphilus]